MRRSNLLKVTEPVSGRAKIWSQSTCSQSPYHTAWKYQPILEEWEEARHVKVVEEAAVSQEEGTASAKALSGEELGSFQWEMGQCGMGNLEGSTCHTKQFIWWLTLPQGPSSMPCINLTLYNFLIQQSPVIHITYPSYFVESEASFTK